MISRPLIVTVATVATTVRAVHFGQQTEQKSKMKSMYPDPYDFSANDFYPMYPSDKTNDAKQTRTQVQEPPKVLKTDHHITVPKPMPINKELAAIMKAQGKSSKLQMMNAQTIKAIA